MEANSEQAPPVMGFSATGQAAPIMMRAGQIPYLIGGPGLGKSAIARLIADATGRDLVIVIGSNLDPTDVGGMPIVTIVDGERVLERVPMTAIRECLRPNMILFLDELTGVPLSVRQPMLRLTLEKVAGDLALHPDLWILAAGNLPEQCPAGQEIDAALGNRLKQIIFLPSRDEVCAHIRTLGDDGSPLRAACVTWAATALEDGQLLQMEPPEESLQTGHPFASPRAIEGGLRMLVEAQQAGLPKSLQRDILQTAWGQAVTARYWGILQYAEFLPTSADICKDPTAATLPEKTEHQIAAFGVLNNAATVDGWAAWIYAMRLPAEVRSRMIRQLMADNVTRTSKLSKKSKWAKQGAKARKAGIIENQKAMKGAI
jgi:hypothetical protein